MEISIKMIVTLVGGVSINCIYYTIFSRTAMHVQIICGNPELRGQAALSSKHESGAE